MSCFLAGCVFSLLASENTFVVIPPGTRLVPGFAITGLPCTRRRPTFAWSKFVWHACSMGPYGLIQPCRCVRPAPEVCVQSAGFENSNLAPRLKWEVSLSDHSCVAAVSEIRQNEFVQRGGAVHFHY